MKKVNFLIHYYDHLVPTDGYHIGKHGGFELIAHKNGHYWVVSELLSGLRITPSTTATTRKSAIEQAIAIIDELDKELIASAHKMMREKTVNTLSIIK